MARSTGKIQHLFIPPKQNVKKGSIIAVIENTTDFQTLQKIKTILETKKSWKYDLFLEIPTISLGSLEKVYQRFLQTLQEYENYQNYNVLQHYIISTKQQIEYYNSLNQNLLQQNNLLQKDLQLTRRQFKTDSILYFKAGGISERELEKTKKILINKKRAVLQNQATIISNQLIIADYQQQIVEYQLKFDEKKQVYLNTIQKSHAELMAKIISWEQKYVLISPIAGKIDTHQFYTENQQVKKGDSVFSIIPNHNQFHCEAQIPAKNIGEVRVGQQAWITFDAFPEQEYGKLKTTIKSISIVPQKGNYSVTLSLPFVLNTTSNKNLSIRPLMRGNAEIITKKMSLLEQVFYRIHSTIQNPLLIE